MWRPRDRLAHLRLLSLVALLLLTACGRQGGEAGNGAAASGTRGQPEQPAAGTVESATATPFILPTLFPTNTPAIAPTSAPAEVIATPTAQSTVDFTQPVVELRYRIPALGLDRRLEGNVSGQITVVDETAGVAGIRQNQGGVLLELQEVLPSLDLEPLPEGCDTCVAFSYAIPLEEVEGEGWLQDPVLLASVENYTSALLGPHFPPGTVLGLRRSATAYDVAHSLALTGDGALYRWLATAPEVSDAGEVATAAPELSGLLASVSGTELADQYVISCVSAPMETLYLNPQATPEGGGLLVEEGQAIRIVCPAFSLSQALLPLYLQLDALLDETLEGSGLPRPPTEVRLDSVLDYQRADGMRLEMALDGAARITGEAGDVVTTTVDGGELNSIMEAFLESELLQPGLERYAAGEWENLLLVRGEQGLLELDWPGAEAPQAIAETLARLDELIEQEISSAEAEE